jgi:very-short-patch-repair endonuclease
MHPLLQQLLTTEGVVRQRDHPQLVNALVHARRRGELVSPLPGVFVPPQASTAIWLRAVSTWGAPWGVIHRESAASLWLPELRSTAVWLAHPTLRSRGTVQVTRRVIPPEWVTVVAGTRFAKPGYAAVELAGRDEGRALCEALRQNLVGSDELPAILESLAGTPHQPARRAVVLDAMRNPWSFGELQLHKILISAGIHGWVANRPLRCGGATVIPDIRFLHVKLVIEFDGRSVHQQRFIADRERQNRLEAAGFRVIRFGWEHLDHPDYIVATVRTALLAT